MLLISGSVAAAPAVSSRALDEVRAAADRGQWLAAEGKAAELLRLARDADEDTVWELRIRRGEALASLARFAESREMLQPELPPRLARGRIAVRRLLALTALSFYGGDRKAAARYIDQAQELAASSQPFLLPNALLYRSFLDPAESDNLLRRALQLARKNGNELAELNIEYRIQHYHLVQGHQYVEAIRSFERLLTRTRALHYDGLELKLEGELGWALRDIGDFEQAAGHFERAVKASEKTGAILDRIPFINQFANVAHDRGDLATADRYYRIAYSLAKPIGHSQLGMITHNLATIALESGHYDEARRLAQESEAIKTKRGDAESLLMTRILDSQIAAGTGDYETARKLVEAVPKEADRPETRWLAEAQLAAVYAAEKRNDDADRQFRRALATLRDARSGIQQEPMRLSFNNEAGAVVDDYVDFLVAAQRGEEALRAVETVQGQTLEEGLGISTNRDPKTIARQARSSILYYHLGPKHSYVWTITADNVTVATLPPRSTIHRTIDAYIRDLLGPAGGSMSRGTELFRMLVEPTGIRSGRVIVIPDGRLNVLNLETLVVPAPKQHFWIEDVVLRNAPSLQLLGREPQVQKPVKSVLLVGNAPQADPAYPALPNAGREVAVVAKRFSRAVVLDHANATPSAYRNASPATYDVLHFVAHGEATIANPFDSAVILGPDPNGYKLFARDIIKQPITARLVTISSCYGAGKRTYVGEGLVGLAWAFVRAGAQQVIAAVWDVNDAATPDLMDAMYKSINAGRDPATALRDAKLMLIHSKGLKPKYWAPFVIYSGM